MAAPPRRPRGGAPSRPRRPGLDLPSTGGFSVLQAVKSDPALGALPVVVLASSPSLSDLVAAYEQHANACLLKPVDPDEFVDLVGRCVDFWLSSAALPRVFDDDERR